MNIENTIRNEEGYMLYPGFIPAVLCADFLGILDSLKTVRAINSNKEYKEKDECASLDNIAICWSQLVHDFPEFHAIRRLVDPFIKQTFPNLEFYASDVVTVKSGSNYISPHVDTPHRFNKWNYNKDLLGLQCIISLLDTDKNNASTGLVPFSQKRDFDIQQCYKGTFDSWFMSNYKQHEMPRGTLLFYNCRVLHSSMPNLGTQDRPALLLNYLDRKIIDEVASVDNVWVSNGKRS